MDIKNRKAYHDYLVESELECGIVLRGNEVKSILAGKVSLKESWVTIRNGELILQGMHISPWSTANTFDVDPLRDKVLLAHKKEIRSLGEQISQVGYTLVPLRLYQRDHHIKLLLGICKGKKLYDKRQALKETQAKREIAKTFKTMNKGE